MRALESSCDVALQRPFVIVLCTVNDPDLVTLAAHLHNPHSEPAPTLENLCHGCDIALAPGNTGYGVAFCYCCA